MILYLQRSFTHFWQIQGLNLKFKQIKVMTLNWSKTIYHAILLVMRKIQVYGQIRLEQRIGFFSKQTTLKSKTHVLVQYPIFKVTMHNNCRCFQSIVNHNQRHSVKGYFCPVFSLTVCTCKQFCFFLNSPRQCCTYREIIWEIWIRLNPRQKHQK